MKNKLIKKEWAESKSLDINVQLYKNFSQLITRTAITVYYE